MYRYNNSPENTDSKGYGNIPLIEQLTPLARLINCLNLEQITDVCIKQIPSLVGARLASLYILDETSNILHLQKHNHSFLINKIVSLNQNPPSLMVMAVISKELKLVGVIDGHKDRTDLFLG